MGVRNSDISESASIVRNISRGYPAQSRWVRAVVVVVIAIGECGTRAKPASFADKSHCAQMDLGVNTHGDVNPFDATPTMGIVVNAVPLTFS